MAELNPRIILAGELADIPGSFQRGLEFKNRRRELGANRQISDLFQAQGPALRSGNPAALDALSRVDPAAAQNLETGALQNQTRISAGERKRELFEARRALVLIERADTPEKWDAVAAKVAPELVGQFARREELATTFQSIVEALDPSTPDKPRIIKGAGGEIIQLVPDGQGGFGVQVIREGQPEAAGQPSALDEKIAALMGTGLSLNQAQGIASGRFKVGGDPPRVVDVATGQIVGGAPSDVAGAGPGVAQEDTLFEQAGSATGLFSSLLSLVADVPGQIPGAVGRAFVNEDVVKARQDFATSTQAMLQAFVINPKFPVAEVNRIKDEIGAVSGAFTSPNAMRIRLRSLDRSLRRSVALQEQTANDPRISSKEAAAAAANARAMRQFIAIMGVPPDEGIEDLRDSGPVGGVGGAKPTDESAEIDALLRSLGVLP